MADHTAIYRNAAVSGHAISPSQILPMQIIEFNYTKADGPRRVCLSLGYVPTTKMLHCIRLNALPLNHFRLLTKPLIDHKLREIYKKANKRGELIESLMVNKFKLPLTEVPYAQLPSFYASNFKNNRYLHKNKVYRTYSLDGMSSVAVVLPDLEYLGLIPRSDKQMPTAEDLWKNTKED